MSKASLKQRVHNGEAINIGGASLDTSKGQLEDILSKDLRFDRCRQPALSVR
jgi:hypothetical protein